ncbi:MAG TPA: molybdopterin-dependent oxidoreductase, partial [Thermoleophilaceae bacterium]
MIGGVAYTTCPLCEATCGLELQLADDGSVGRVRGDDDDVFSKGFICPKGGSITALHEDPDRLRTPMVRRDGELVEASWEEAFAEIDKRLPPILEQHGRNAVGVYLGNPSVHNLSFTLYGRVLLKALGTRNIFSASTVDQMPKQVSAGLMFGTFLSIPIPDIDRTDYMLMLGANPLASNGSLMTAPDYRGRMRAVRDRGGKIVVIDPRRSRTAENADEHHFIRPGGDAFFLAALAREIFETGLADVGEVAEHVEGVERVRELVAPFDAERAAAACGIP